MRSASSSCRGCSRHGRRSPAARNRRDIIRRFEAVEAMPVTTQRAARPRGTIPRWAVWGLAAAFTVGALLSGVLVYRAVRDLAAAWTGTGPTPFEFSGSIPTAAPGETAVPVAAVATAVPRNGSDRITILVMGLDYRDWESGTGAPATESIVLFTAEPVVPQG